MAKKSCTLFGVIFLIAGIWGIIQGSFFGVFVADTSSSLIHIIVGVILVVLASKPSAQVSLKVVGVIYIIFALLGFFQGTKVLWFVTDGATTWLYLVLGIIVAALGWSSKNGVGSHAPAFS